MFNNFNKAPKKTKKIEGNKAEEKMKKSLVEKLTEVFAKDEVDEKEVSKLMDEFYIKYENCNSENSLEFSKFSSLIEKNDPNYSSSLEIGDINSDGFRTLYTKSWFIAFTMEMQPNEILNVPYFIKNEDEEEVINPFWENLEHYKGIKIEG